MSYDEKDDDGITASRHYSVTTFRTATSSCYDVTTVRCLTLDVITESDEVRYYELKRFEVRRAVNTGGRDDLTTLQRFE